MNYLYMIENCKDNYLAIVSWMIKSESKFYYTELDDDNAMIILGLHDRHAKQLAQAFRCVVVKYSYDESITGPRTRISAYSAPQDQAAV